MIDISTLDFWYKKRLPLFQELTLMVPPGNIYGLLGRNGAGKTTLLKLMTGLLNPKAGQVEVYGHRAFDRHPSMLADIYFIPEEIYVPAIKISTFVGLYAPFYPRFDQAQFERYLRQFELNADQKITQLSYGQKKKVLLGFGLATNCRLLILDEPTNGLDIPSKSQFRRLLAGSITEERTFIISTHQVRDVGNLIDPIIILDEGKIIFQHSIAEISARLSFELQSHEAQPGEALYAERVPGGYLWVSKNELGEESEVDLEALFNAVIQHQDQIDSIFANALTHEA